MLLGLTLAENPAAVNNGGVRFFLRQLKQNTVPYPVKEKPGVLPVFPRSTCLEQTVVVDSFNLGYILIGARSETMGDMAQAREPQRGLTFEDVWAAMMETDKRFQETDRRLQELTEQLRETDRQITRTDRQLGELGNRFGELAEHLVTPNIAEKFRALNYTFTKAGPDVAFFNRDGSFLAEVDVWLENGEFAMAVEVKSRLRTGHVDDHIRRMEILRSYFDERKDLRKLLGAVAGAIVPPDLRNYVLKKGFYLIEQSGDTVKITVPGGFKPRIW
jgi:hypothetical protein